VASEDTDVLAYGTPTFITKINTSDETCVEINYEELTTALGLTQEQFTDLCIMCGTDYNENMKGIGPDKSYKLLVENGLIEDLEKIVDNKTGELKFDTSVLKYKRGREMFSTPEVIKQKIPYCGKPDTKKLQRWLFENNISFNIEAIVRSFERKEELVFED
jgi:flap endonuclease-1